MITKQHLFEIKDAENYCKVTIESPAANLSSLYEVLDSALPAEIREDVYIVGHEVVNLCIYELTLDVDDVDFSEFED